MATTRPESRLLDQLASLVGDGLASAIDALSNCGRCRSEFGGVASALVQAFSAHCFSGEYDEAVLGQVRQLSQTCLAFPDLHPLVPPVGVAAAALWITQTIKGKGLYLNANVVFAKELIPLSSNVELQIAAMLFLQDHPNAIDKPDVHIARAVVSGMILRGLLGAWVTQNDDVGKKHRNVLSWVEVMHLSRDERPELAGVLRLVRLDCESMLWALERELNDRPRS